MTRKRALAAGTGVIGLTIIAVVAFQSRSGTALPDVKAPESNESKRPGISVQIVRLGEGTASPPEEHPPQRLSSPALFSVGILRDDAVLIPFASFDGVSWLNSWPEGFVPSVLPRLSEIPPGWWGGDEPALRWELLDFHGGRQVVTATGVREFETHCSANVGLTTTFTSRVTVEPDNLTVAPVDYAGVAATVDNLLAPVARLGKDDRDFQAIERFLPQLFTRLESDVWQNTVGSKDRAIFDRPLTPGDSKLCSHRDATVRRRGLFI